MDRPTKRTSDIISQVRERYLSVLEEPIPPNLVALVEQLREQERVKKERGASDTTSSKSRK